MTDDQVERCGKAWEAGEREDRSCGLCGNFIQPGQWMRYHYNADGSRAIEHVTCDHPEKDQRAHYLQVTPPNAGRPAYGEAREWALRGTQSLRAPGSPEWCWQTINLLKTYYQYVEDAGRRCWLSWPS